MLPISHLDCYSKFRQQCETLLQETDPRTIKSSTESLQQNFQTEIAPLNLDELDENDPILESRVRSLHVELDKQLRLLKMDATFLQTAKQAETIQQRLGQVRDRLTTMIGYCKILLGETSGDQ
jgi:hypothetical protein